MRGDPWFEHLAAKLRRLRREGRWRTMRGVDGPLGPEVTLEGRRVIHLAGNDYLGLSRHPAVIEAAGRATRDLGVGSGASRLLGGDLAPHRQLERDVAEFKRVEAAIVFSSGFLANLGAITALTGAGDLILSDELNHASLVDACRLSRAETRIYPHADAAVVAHILGSSPPGRRVLIVTDGVFSMDGDLAPLAELMALTEKHRALLLLDDAHGTGVLGDTGRGTAELGRVSGPRLIQVGTFSKALGSLGGFVAGAEPVIETLRQRARSFIYTTALPPAISAASRAALGVVDDEPWRRLVLLDHSRRLRRFLTDMGYDVPEGTTQIIPVLVKTETAAVALSERLLAHGVFAPAVRPPTVPTGKCRLRLSLRADHTIDHLDRVIEAFARAASKTTRRRAVG
ncbi:MAG: 8-amino-7-oxononanoate synthase [Proteobacteria bacterium]|nr:8-amino-7-oxononanoate synthase [Pseudomonadota bacterium]MBU1743046.1 8-amino-7-oxononanoate synthase [Pseudomonadota bacterium]